MSDEMRVMVVATGLGRANEGANKLLESTRSDGSIDYQQLERPTVLRKQATLKPAVAEPVVSDMDYLDIPAFLRRQEEA
jgi:cell division protein FtsZ